MKTKEMGILWMLVLIAYTINTPVCCAAEAAAKDFAFNANQSCDRMEPVYVGHIPAIGEEASWTLPELITSKNKDFQLVVADKQYHRNKQIEIQLQGERQIEKFLVEVRSTKDPFSRIGQFVNLGDYLKDLGCDDNAGVTAVYSADGAPFGNKTSIYWQAPDDPNGDLKVSVTLLAGDNQWLLESEVLKFNQFPPTLRDCNVNKSCAYMCPSGDTSKPDECSYVLTWSIVGNKTTLEMVLGGQVDNNSYIGVGFIPNITAFPNDLELITVQLSDKKVKPQPYIYKNGTLSEAGPNYQWSFSANWVDGSHIWCKFYRPLPLMDDSDMVDLNEQVALLYVKEAELEVKVPDHLAYKNDKEFWKSSEDYVYVVDIGNHPFSGSAVPSVSSTAVLVIGFFAVLLAYTNNAA